MLTGQRWEPTRSRRSPGAGTHSGGPTPARLSVSLSGSAASDKSRGLGAEPPFPVQEHFLRCLFSWDGRGSSSPWLGRACRAVDLRETVATLQTLVRGRRRHTTPAPVCEPRQSPPSFHDCCLWPSWLRTSRTLRLMRRAAKNSQARAFPGPRLLILTRPWCLPLLRSLRFSPSALRYAPPLG